MAFPWIQAIFSTLDYANSTAHLGHTRPQQKTLNTYAGLVFSAGTFIRTYPSSSHSVFGGGAFEYGL